MATTASLGLLKLLPSSIRSTKLIPKPSLDLPLPSRNHSPFPHLEHAALRVLSKASFLPATAGALSLSLFLNPQASSIPQPPRSSLLSLLLSSSFLVLNCVIDFLDRRMLLRSAGSLGSWKGGRYR